MKRIGKYTSLVIRQLEWLLVIVPPEHYQAFYTENFHINLNRGRITTAFIGFMQLILLALGVCSIGQPTMLAKSYQALYWVIVIHMIVYYLIFTVMLKRIPNYRMFWIAEIAFVLAILVCAVGITMLDQVLYGQITFYVLCILATAVMPIIQPALMLVIFLMAHTMLLALLPIYQSNSNVLTGHYINSSVLVILAWVISRTLYAYRYNNFVNQLTIIKQNEQLNVSNTKLARLSMQDELTQVYNRRGFMQEAENTFRRAAIEKTSLALMIVDIDNLKMVNDTYGHLFGDSCIKKVAETLAHNVRQGIDIVGRYGGDEFAVLLPHTSKNEAAKIAERMRKQVESTTVTVSIGCLIVTPKNSDRFVDLFQKADKALYRAKNKRRNCAVFLDDVEDGIC